MIFVTGGTGLVGAHLLYELTCSGKKVRALKRNHSNLDQVVKTFRYYTPHYQQLFDKIEWVDGDILDYGSIETALGGVTEIYHCAAIVSFARADRKKMISNNVEGTANLVNAAIDKKIERFCHVSSIAALGRNQDDQPVTEETNWVPVKHISGYSESKFFSENEVWRGTEEGLNAVIVNPSIILGPANWDSGSAKLFKTVWNGMKFYTRGTTGFVDVRDVVSAMVRLMDSQNFELCKNQRFILNAENLSYHSLFNQIADALGKPRPSYFASDFLLEITWRAATLFGWLTFKPNMITRDTVSNSNRNFVFDGSKISRTTGFIYRSIQDSIKEISLFFKADQQTSGTRKE